MGVSLGPARAHRPQRGSAIERLDLTLLTRGQWRGAIRRIQIQRDDIADFLDERRILRELERLDAMGGDAKALQIGAIAVWRMPQCVAKLFVEQWVAAPWHRFQRRDQHAFHIGVG